MQVIVTKEPLCSLVYFLFCIYIAFVEAPFAWIQAIDFFLLISQSLLKLPNETVAHQHGRWVVYVVRICLENIKPIISVSMKTPLFHKIWITEPG